MISSVCAFWLPKAGNAVAEYEDAFAYSSTEGRFAVADGATDSAFAGRWARSLVQGFTASPPQLSQESSGELHRWLEPFQQTWHAEIDWECLPWYGLEKAQTGAFSTLLGLELAPRESSAPPTLQAPTPGGLRWHALAVGDSCLFHVRDDMLVMAFPLTRAEQFSNRPVLLSSNPANNRLAWDAVWLTEGECQPADLFFLATDALAHWCLARHAAGGKPWADLDVLKTEAAFVSFIADLRAEHAIRNDDVTLLAIRLGLQLVPADKTSEGNTAG